MIEYVKGDLFKVAPKDAYLLHACNCKGSWGAGIAKAFKAYYPMDYLEYVRDCKKTSPGDILITKNKIICLYTSEDFGRRTDDVGTILSNTSSSLSELVIRLETGATVYSPKINSGLFQVPWEASEQLILAFLKVRPDVTWAVSELD